MFELQFSCSPGNSWRRIRLNHLHASCIRERSGHNVMKRADQCSRMGKCTSGDAVSEPLTANFWLTHCPLSLQIIDQMKHHFLLPWEDSKAPLHVQQHTFLKWRTHSSISNHTALHPPTLHSTVIHSFSHRSLPLTHSPHCVAHNGAAWHQGA